MLNRQATVRVEIYNLEGERAIAREFVENPGNLIQTAFDEGIDVGRLRSGVYVLRLTIKGAGGSESFTKTFAVLR